NEKKEKARLAAREAAGTVKESAAKVGKEADAMMQSARRSGKVVAGEAEKLSDEAKARAARVAAEAKRTASRVAKDAEENLR
ncbi:MAG TPA: hypothetical protein VIQ80_03055, partial [Candidatus Saccharimonadales bacterium]